MKFPLTFLSTYLNLNALWIRKLQFSIDLFSKSTVIQHLCSRKAIQTKTSLKYTQHTQQMLKVQEPLIKCIQSTNIYPSFCTSLSLRHWEYICPDGDRASNKKLMAVTHAGFETNLSGVWPEFQNFPKFKTLSPDVRFTCIH